MCLWHDEQPVDARVMQAGTSSFHYLVLYTPANIERPCDEASVSLSPVSALQEDVVQFTCACWPLPSEPEVISQGKRQNNNHYLHVTD